MTTQTGRVSRADAMAVLRQVRHQFRAYLTDEAHGPTIVRAWNWGYGTVPYAIVWEEGPYEWALAASDGPCCSADWPGMPRQDHVTAPDGVLVEPYTSWALALYEY